MMTMTIRTTSRFATVMMGLGAFAVIPLDAQEVDIDKAMALEVEAMELLDDQEEWSKAARMFRQAAALRPDGDSKARQDLYQASRLAYYRGHERRALNDLENLADRALQEGDVLTAAQALADAAWIANEEGLGNKTLSLSERAQRLALSPYITDEQRAQLKTRFISTAS